MLSLVYFGLAESLFYSFSIFRKPDSISPLDDLAFDMYQDPEVAQIIRTLDEKKREAVHRERYDDAKKLKQAIADLQKVLLKGCECPASVPAVPQGPWHSSAILMISNIFSK